MLNSIQSEARAGLSEDIRSSLLSKYEGADSLAPPKLNKELVPALAPSLLSVTSTRLDHRLRWEHASMLSVQAYQFY